MKLRPRPPRGSRVLGGLVVLLALALPAAGQEGAAGTDVGEARAWLDVELPRGFYLDPATGVVSSRPSGPRALTLGPLGLAAVTPGALRLAELAPEEGAAASASRLVELGDGEPVDALPAERGAEAVFPLRADGGADGEDPAVGYLRVVDTVSGALGGGVVLEYARSAPGVARLERRPAELSVAHHPDGLELSWSAGTPQEGAAWVVERVALDGRGAAARVVERLAVTREPRYLDETAGRETLYEYRVSRWSPADDGAAWGARARGVLDAWRHGASVPVTRGTEVSLLTGESDGLRADLSVEYATPDALQVAPGEGRSLRMLTPDEAAEWELPEPGPAGFASPRMMVQVGRALVVELPEGVLARVDVEPGDDFGPRLRCRVDLDGGRTFPQPPPEPEVRWTPAGVAFDFGTPADSLRRAMSNGKAPLGLAVPPSVPEGASIVVERAVEPGADDFVEVAEGAPGERVVLDPVAGPPRVARYRFRTRAASGLTSPPSEPVRALLVDEGDDAAVEGLIAAAVRDLGDPDYRKRDAARTVLELLEGRALDALGRALRSEDPEVAGSAREILAGLAPDSGTPDAGLSLALVLRARAVAAGLGAEPPIDGLFDDAPVRRAAALLRRLGAEGGAPVAGSELERWRALVAEADPDAGVRLVAQAWGELGAEPRRSALRRLLDAPGTEGGPVRPEEALVEAREALFGATTADEVIDVLARATAGLGAWEELLVLTIAAELEARATGPAQGIDPERLDRVHVALALLERHARADEGVFLDAAERLFDDPSARVVAWRELARRRLERARVEPGAGGRRVVRLGAADSAALDAHLRELEEEGARDVDVLLAPGVYDPPDGAFEALSVPGLRLIGDGDAVLRGMLTVSNAEDVVLSGVAIEGRNRSALMVTSASLTLEDCLLTGGNTVVSGSESIVVLSRCELAATSERTPATGLRLSGRSLALALDTLFDGGGSALQGTSSALLLRCAVDAGPRNGIDGARGGAIVIVDTLIESDAACLSNLERGVLEGAVLVSPQRVATAVRPEVAVCREHLAVHGPEGELEQATPLAECPLGRARLR